MMLSGDGGSESTHLLGMLDLPNSMMMEGSSFPLIQYDLASYILPYTDELLEENLLEEVHLTATELPDFNIELWKEAWTDDKPYAWQLMPQLKVSYDMGWQKCSSGKRYVLTLDMPVLLVARHGNQ